MSQLVLPPVEPSVLTDFAKKLPLAAEPEPEAVIHGQMRGVRVRGRREAGAWVSWLIVCAVVCSDGESVQLRGTGLES